MNENLIPMNKQTYPIVQIVTDNTITHRHTLKLANLKLLISEQLQYTHVLYTLRWLGTIHVSLHHKN